MTSVSDIERAAALFDVLARDWVREWRLAIERELAPAGLNQASALSLIILRTEGDAPTQSDIAEKLGVDGATMMRVLEGLEAEGLVAREVDPADRRRRIVRLTPRGTARTAEVMRQVACLRSEFLEGVSLEELQACIAVLGRIRENQKARAGRAATPAVAGARGR
jgi:MarR family transcriptional regulator, transcriptional regulator for hemolysin